MLKFVFLPPIDANQREWARRLEAALPEFDVRVIEHEEEVKQAVSTADAAYGWVPPEALATARNLRWLQNPYAGPFVGYYYAELAEHPVTVTNPRGIYSDHISHHILMFMLALSRGLPYWFDAQRKADWNPRARQHGYVDIASSTVLINGVGGIGTETARLCAAMGARVIGIDPRTASIPEAEIHAPDELDDLLPTADFVITTVPHTPETELMWNRDRFINMKSTAYFINVGRGMTASLDDLVVALEKRELAGAGLDVFETEPLPPDHRLWSMENVLITPHIAVADAVNISERRYEILLDNAQRFAQDKELRNVVDKSLWY
ncbi:MAG: D-2-hydroxyacid dehydrogenase [Pseudomonadales bacterium]